MRCELLALVLAAGCASAADKEACHPVASLAGPTFACAGGEAAPPPADDKTTTDLTGSEPDPDTETTTDAEPAPEPAVKLEGDLIAVKDPITFDDGTATISDDSKITLLEVAKFLDGHDNIAQIEIRVHAGGQGTKKKNQKLSDARAKAVKDFLVAKGIAKKRLTGKGLGKGDSDDVELDATKYDE